MTFINIINSNGSIIGDNITGSGGVYSSISSLINTTLNSGGIDISGNVTSFTNSYIIFGGGGGGTDISGNVGQNALQVESGKTITTLINSGSFCGGGGGGGGSSVSGQIGTGGNGGAGGGGGGGGYSSAVTSSNGGAGGNGYNGGSNGYGGGGGGFNKPSGGGTNNSNISYLGTIAGGGGGFNANNYGGGVSSNYYGGGAGGGGYDGSGLEQNGGGGGGGGISNYGGNGGYSINNIGQITTLENQQGIGSGLGALFYQGTLPTNYNIIIQSDASYGQLFCSGWGNTSIDQENASIVPIPCTLPNFNISSLSTLSNVSTSYEAVLLNIDTVNNLYQQNVTGTFSKNGISYTWTLTYVLPDFQNTFGNKVSISGVKYSSYDLTITYLPYPCFKEGSKILTDKGYKLIQDLRKGDLVKTAKHGFVPIHLIGKREMYHPGCKERIKEQLYQCSNNNFEEVFEPLIITGCHSILVDDFVNEQQRVLTKEVNGNIYVTDNKYRLPACVDERAYVYPDPGTYTIYHLALENEDYYMNYGIYANGLLVETCSKRYLKELSGMELI